MSPDLSPALLSVLSVFIGVTVCANRSCGEGLPAGNEYHVSVKGDDANNGAPAKPLKTISEAAKRALPGDVITVHEGVYRERVNPPRGGTADDKRIVYRAAPGEKVAIKGSEPVQGWQQQQHDTWKIVLPNKMFGGFNPFKDLIHGDWFHGLGRDHHTAAVYLNGHWLTEAAKLEAVLEAAGETPLWFGQVSDTTTTILAQFKDVDPNQALVEVNVRQSVFYPAQPGMNFITVRGFTLEHAATPWAPPTAEQIGLIGTHWSKGWVIEDNLIRYSVCSGVTLGKHGDKYDNTSANSTEGYVKTIERAVARGWSKENIGHHVIRNNEIAHCEQTGIVGSLGPIFCTITGNTIHDIHVRRLFTGAEMGGIKFHGAIDTVISGNHIFRCSRGIWLDWMAQGTRVSRNLLHDNGPREDLFVEVNHGPFLVDNNLLLSPKSILDWSQGGAFVHNLVTGSLGFGPQDRLTPVHKAHSTEVSKLTDISGGDDRYYNNIFTFQPKEPQAPVAMPPELKGIPGSDDLFYRSDGLALYDGAKLPVVMAGNVFLKGAKPARAEPRPVVKPEFDPAISLVQQTDGFHLALNLDGNWAQQRRDLVTSALLGKAKIPDLPYEQPDTSPYRLDTDYFGHQRNVENPFPGPFAQPKGDKLKLKVWPVDP